MSRRRPLREGEDGVDFKSEPSFRQQESSSPEMPEADEDKACDNVPSPPPNPLQKLVLPWHLVMVVFYALLLYEGSKIDLIGTLDPKNKVVPKFGGKFKFLTHINLWVQLAFFTMQLVTDIIPASYRKNFQKGSDVFFTCIALPVAATVAIPFWSIYSIDRELIYPAVVDQVIPTYMNHCFHTTILLWVLFEIYIFHHHFPSVGTAAACVFGYGSGYISWVVYIYLKTNLWIYRFMGLLPPVFMALFFAGCMFFSLGVHVVGKRLAHARWGVTTPIKGL